MKIQKKKCEKERKKGKNGEILKTRKTNEKSKK